MICFIKSLTRKRGTLEHATLRTKNCASPTTLPPVLSGTTTISILKFSCFACGYTGTVLPQRKVADKRQAENRHKDSR